MVTRMEREGSMSDGGELLLLVVEIAAAERANGMAVHPDRIAKTSDRVSRAWDAFRAFVGREQAGPEKADIQKSTVSEAVSNSPAPVSCVLTCPVREGLERISDRRMWHRLNGELTWRGQTADGNEIEVEDPRDIARMALAAPCLGPPAAPPTAPI